MVRDRKADCDPWGFPGKMQRNDRWFYKMHPLDGWLADLIERTARETAEQTAQRTVEKIHRDAAHPNRIGGATRGKRRCCSGTASRTARQRCQPSRCTEGHPDFANLGRKIGRRWYWLRSDIGDGSSSTPQGKVGPNDGPSDTNPR